MEKAIEKAKETKREMYLVCMTIFYTLINIRLNYKLDENMLFLLATKCANFPVHPEVKHDIHIN